MNCSNCGHELSKKQSFCGNCGTVAPVAPKKDNKRIISIILCVALAISLIINFVLISTTFAKNFSPAKSEGKGFNSPEDALVAYVEAFSEGNVEKMLSTFAIETYVDNFQLEKYISLQLYYDFYNSPIGLPNNSKYTMEINHQTLQGALVKQFKSAYFTLANVDNSKSITTFSIKDKEDEIDDFVDNLKDSKFDKKLSEIKIVDVLDKNDFDYNKELYDKSFKNYSYIDADEFCDVAVEIDYQGESYYMFMTTAKFNGKWYNISPISQLGLLCGMNTSSGGIMEKQL